MNRIIVLFILLSNSFSYAGEIDGKNYCRKVQGGGMGAPAGSSFEHCATFNQNTVTDNAGSAFGNPPETKAYVIDGMARDMIFTKNSEGNYVHAYSFVSKERKQIQVVGGAILTLVEKDKVNSIDDKQIHNGSKKKNINTDPSGGPQNPSQGQSSTTGG